MTGLPGGLADAIARQLERQMGRGRRTAGRAGPPLNAVAQRDARCAAPAQRAANSCALHAEAARAAEGASGIPAAFMVAQAAHETGWGQHEIRKADGRNSHNLFGIKAGAGWKGPRRRGHDHRIRQRPGAEADAEIPRLRRATTSRSPTTPRLMKDQPALRKVLRRAPADAQALRAGPAARRLRHRPGLRRQARPRHQHHAAPAARRWPEGLRRHEQPRTSDVDRHAGDDRELRRACRRPATTSPTPTSRATRASRSSSRRRSASSPARASSARAST